MILHITIFFRLIKKINSKCIVPDPGSDIFYMSFYLVPEESLSNIKSFNVLRFTV